MPWGYNIYVTERAGNRIVRWQPDVGTASVVAAGAAPGGLSGVAVDGNGHVITHDAHQRRTVRVQGSRLEAESAVEDERFGWSCSIAANASGDVFVGGCSDIQRRRGAQSERIAGPPPGNSRPFRYEPRLRGQAALDTATLYQPGSLCCLPSGEVAFIERMTLAVRILQPGVGLRTVVRGRAGAQAAPMGPIAVASGEDPQAPVFPSCLAVSATGDLLIGDGFQHAIYRMDEGAGLLCPLTGLPADITPVSMVTAPGNMLWLIDAQSQAAVGYRNLGVDTVQSTGLACKLTVSRGDFCAGIEGDAITWGWV